MVAERLGWPAATLGASLEVADGVVTIRRDTDTASLTVEATLPAVVSVTDQSGEARYPSMKGILSAKKKPVRHLGAVRPRDRSRLRRASMPPGPPSPTPTPRPPKEAGKVVPDADGAGSAALVEFLAAGKFI